jgi:spermidine/putrescine transport system permease protein
LLPALIWLCLFLLLPVVIILVFSLGSRSPLGQIELGFSLNNYWRFFSGPYLLSLSRSLGLAFSNTAICLVLGFATALWLAFVVKPSRQGLFLTLITAPLWTSFLLRMYAWIIILRPNGLLSGLLEGWNLSSELLYTDQAVLLGMVYNYLPYMILPLYTTLEKLDKRFLEAAADLGANSWQTFCKVTIPLSSRGIVAGIIMVFVPSLGDYVTPDLLGGAKSMYIGNLIQNQFLVVRDWAFGSAVSTILMLIVGIAIFIYLKYGDAEPA